MTLVIIKAICPSFVIIVCFILMFQSSYHFRLLI